MSNSDNALRTSNDEVQLAERIYDMACAAVSAWNGGDEIPYELKRSFEQWIVDAKKPNWVQRHAPETAERAKLCHGKAHVPITTCATCGCFIGSVTDLPGAAQKASEQPSAFEQSSPRAYVDSLPDTETSLEQYVNRVHKGSRVLREYLELVKAAQNAYETRRDGKAIDMFEAYTPRDVAQILCDNSPRCDDTCTHTSNEQHK